MAFARMNIERCPRVIVVACASAIVAAIERCCVTRGTCCICSSSATRCRITDVFVFMNIRAVAWDAASRRRLCVLARVGLPPFMAVDMISWRLRVAYNVGTELFLRGMCMLL